MAEGFQGQSKDMPGGTCMGHWAAQPVFLEALKAHYLIDQWTFDLKQPKIWVDVIESLKAAQNRQFWRRQQAEKLKVQNGQ